MKEIKKETSQKLNKLLDIWHCLKYEPIDICLSLWDERNWEKQIPTSQRNVSQGNFQSIPLGILHQRGHNKLKLLLMWDGLFCGKSIID